MNNKRFDRTPVRSGQGCAEQGGDLMGAVNVIRISNDGVVSHPERSDHGKTVITYRSSREGSTKQVTK